MSKLDLNIRYTTQKENTEFMVEVNYEKPEKQDDQSPRGLLGLVRDCCSLAVRMLEIVSVLADALSDLF